MLILTRRLSEAVVIDDKDIVLTILGIKGNQVKLGFETQSPHAIDREEVYLQRVVDGTKKTKLSKNAPIKKSYRPKHLSGSLGSEYRYNARHNMELNTRQEKDRKRDRKSKAICDDSRDE